MVPFALKVFLSALLIAGSSELARRSTMAGAILISLPLTSLIAMLWLWRDTHDGERIAAFSVDMLWLVPPSLLLFIVLPLMLRSGFGFWLSLACGVGATMAAYAATVLLRGNGA
jgi:hypothetical protein